jgi:hypothetical protein
VRPDEIRVRGLEPGDLKRLQAFRCRTGEPWEDVVEQQIRGPLPRRYLGPSPAFDGRMLIASNLSDDLLAVGAHSIEPTFLPDVGYTEVIAVALAARRTLVTLTDGRPVSLGAFMLLTIFQP